MSCLQRVGGGGARGRGRSRKTLEQCVRNDMKLLGLHSEVGYFKGYVEGLDLGQTSYPSLAWKRGRFFKINDDR